MAEIYDWDLAVAERRRARAASLGIAVEELDERERAAELASRLRATRREIQKVGASLPTADIERLAACTYDATRAVEIVRRFLASNRRYLVLAGPTGCGKTLAAILACLCDNSAGARDEYDEIPTLLASGELVSATVLARRMDPWRADLDAGVVPLHVERPRTLVLDDLGTEAVDARFESALFRLIDGRQGRGRTVITSNLPEAVLRHRYDARIWSRIDHQGVVAELAGDDLRRRPRAPGPTTTTRATSNDEPKERNDR